MTGTRSTAELGWVGQVMDGIKGLVRTMEKKEKRAERYRRGLDTRLKAVEGSVMDLGKMTKMGVMSIKTEQYKLRKAVERDDEGMKRVMKR